MSDDPFLPARRLFAGGDAYIQVHILPSVCYFGAARPSTRSNEPYLITSGLRTLTLSILQSYASHRHLKYPLGLCRRQRYDPPQRIGRFRYTVSHRLPKTPCDTIPQAPWPVHERLYLFAFHFVYTCRLRPASLGTIDIYPTCDLPRAFGTSWASGIG